MMQDKVKIAAVQFQTRVDQDTPDPHAMVVAETRACLDSLKGYGLNLVAFSEGIESVCQTMEQAEEMERPGPLLQTYMDFAAQEKCHVAGSAKILEHDRTHNSIVFIGPNGNVLGAYHKTFLTHGEIEAGLTPGRGAVVIDTDIGRLGGVICFDLNFDELRAEYAKLRPDILLFASMFHGGLMQQVWAYSCRSYLVSAMQFAGCGILDPFGRAIRRTDCYTTVARATVNLDRVMVHLDVNRDKFPDIEKKYGDAITIDVPANIGSALIVSNDHAVSARDVVGEFDLLLLDDYLARARETNEQARTSR